MSTKVHNTFGGFLGHPTTIMTRTAVADFAGPVEMGSPCNVLGNEAMETSGVGSSPLRRAGRRLLAQHVRDEREQGPR